MAALIFGFLFSIMVVGFYLFIAGANKLNEQYERLEEELKKRDEILKEVAGETDDIPNRDTEPPVGS